jgi:hypothetical protein
VRDNTRKNGEGKKFWGVGERKEREKIGREYDEESEVQICRMMDKM